MHVRNKIIIKKYIVIVFHLKKSFQIVRAETKR
jgi:hypothetical protein